MSLVNLKTIRDFAGAYRAFERSTATARAGETKLSDVAKRLGVSPDALARANPQIKDGIHLKPGQEIRIPTDPSPVSRPSTRAEPAELPGTPEQRGGSTFVQYGEPDARSMVQARMLACVSKAPEPEVWTDRPQTPNDPCQVEQPGDTAQRAATATPDWAETQAAMLGDMRNWDMDLKPRIEAGLGALPSLVDTEKRPPNQTLGGWLDVAKRMRQADHWFANRVTHRVDEHKELTESAWKEESRGLPDGRLLQAKAEMEARLKNDGNYPGRYDDQKRVDIINSELAGRTWVQHQAEVGAMSTPDLRAAALDAARRGDSPERLKAMNHVLTHRGYEVEDQWLRGRRSVEEIGAELDKVAQEARQKGGPPDAYDAGRIWTLMTELHRRANGPKDSLGMRKIGDRPFVGSAKDYQRAMSRHDYEKGEILTSDPVTGVIYGLTGNEGLARAFGGLAMGIGLTAQGRASVQGVHNEVGQGPRTPAALVEPQAGQTRSSGPPSQSARRTLPGLGSMGGSGAAGAAGGPRAKEPVDPFAKTQVDPNARNMLDPLDWTLRNSEMPVPVNAQHREVPAASQAAPREQTIRRPPPGILPELQADQQTGQRASGFRSMTPQEAAFIADTHPHQVPRPWRIGESMNKEAYTQRWRDSGGSGPPPPNGYVDLAHSEIVILYREYAGGPRVPPR